MALEPVGRGPAARTVRRGGPSEPLPFAPPVPRGTQLVSDCLLRACMPDRGCDAKLGVSIRYSRTDTSVSLGGHTVCCVLCCPFLGQKRLCPAVGALDRN